MAQLVQFNDLTKPADRARLNQFIREIIAEVGNTQVAGSRGRVVGGGGGGTTNIVNNITQEINNRPSILYGTLEKSPNALVTDYLKDECIIPQPLTADSKIVVAEPLGNYDPAVAAWTALALIFKNGAGEMTIARDILDTLVLIQNADGSWYFQYNPFTNAAGTAFDHVTAFYRLGTHFYNGPQQSVALGSPSFSGDYLPDFTTSMVVWAMAAYDDANASTRYRTAVQKALDFIRTLQLAMQTAQGLKMIPSGVYQGVTDTVANTGSNGIDLMAIAQALNTYGNILTSGINNVLIGTMANDLYAALQFTWTGDAGRYYNVCYPSGSNTAVPVYPKKEKMPFTQMMVVWASYVFVNSGFLTATNNSYQIELAIDFLLPITTLQWGGQPYSPYLGLDNDNTDEYASFTAITAQALATVNPAKYSRQIALSQAFLQLQALDDGRIFEVVDPASYLWRYKATAPAQVTNPITVSDGTEGYGFLAWPSALALLAGA